MSERLTKALEFANYRQTLNNQIASLRSKTQTIRYVSASHDLKIKKIITSGTEVQNIILVD